MTLQKFGCEPTDRDVKDDEKAAERITLAAATARAYIESERLRNLVAGSWSEFKEVNELMTVAVSEGTA